VGYLNLASHLRRTEFAAFAKYFRLWTTLLHLPVASRLAHGLLITLVAASLHRVEPNEFGECSLMRKTSRNWDRRWDNVVWCPVESRELVELLGIRLCLSSALRWPG